MFAGDLYLWFYLQTMFLSILMWIDMATGPFFLVVVLKVCSYMAPTYALRELFNVSGHLIGQNLSYLPVLPACVHLYTSLCDRNVTFYLRHSQRSVFVSFISEHCGSVHKWERSRKYNLKEDRLLLEKHFMQFSEQCPSIICWPMQNTLQRLPALKVSQLVATLRPEIPLIRQKTRFWSQFYICWRPPLWINQKLYKPLPPFKYVTVCRLSVFILSDSIQCDAKIKFYWTNWMEKGMSITLGN